MSYETHKNSQYHIRQEAQQYDAHHDLSARGIDGVPLRATTVPVNARFNAGGGGQGNNHKQGLPLRSRSHDHSTKGYQQVGSRSRASYSPKQADYPTRSQKNLHYFDRRRQMSKLLGYAAGRFLVIILFIAIFVVVLRRCKQPISRRLSLHCMYVPCER